MSDPVEEIVKEAHSFLSLSAKKTDATVGVESKVIHIFEIKPGNVTTKTTYLSTSPIITSPSGLTVKKDCVPAGIISNPQYFRISTSVIDRLDSSQGGSQLGRDSIMSSLIFSDGTSTVYVDNHTISAEWVDYLTSTTGVKVLSYNISIQGTALTEPTSLLTVCEDVTRIVWTHTEPSDYAGMSFTGYISSVTARQTPECYPYWIVQLSYFAFPLDPGYYYEEEVQENAFDKGSILIFWSKGTPGTAEITAKDIDPDTLDLGKFCNVKYGGLNLFAGTIDNYSTYTKTIDVDGIETEETWSTVSLVDSWKLLMNASPLPSLRVLDSGSAFTVTLADSPYTEIATTPNELIEWICSQIGMSYVLASFDWASSSSAFSSADWDFVMTTVTPMQLLNWLIAVSNQDHPLEPLRMSVDSTGQLIFCLGNTPFDPTNYKLTSTGKYYAKDDPSGAETEHIKNTYIGALGQVGVPSYGSNIESIRISLFNPFSTGRISGNRWIKNGIVRPSPYYNTYSATTGEVEVTTVG